MSNSHVINLDARLSDSPLVETVWRSHSRQPGPFLSIASSRWEMIVAQHDGRSYFTVRGPETYPVITDCPPDGEWLGIQFKHGVFIPKLPVSALVNGGVDLPEASNRSFWMHGSTWEFPTFENAETYIAHFVEEDLLVVDSIVAATLQAQATELSARSIQRRFLRATGLTHGAVSQIERAHHAVALLRQGVSILDTVDLAGYADQPHLTRSLKRLIGQTPAQLASKGEMQLSFSPVIELAESARPLMSPMVGG